MVTKLTRAFVSREQINKIANQVLGDLLPGQSEQSIFEASSTQRYRLGSGLQSDEREFVYAHFGADITNPPHLHRLLVARQQVLATNDRTPDVVHPVGSTLIKLPDTTATLDQYKNGWMEIWNAGGVASFQLRRILHNTATDGTYAYFTIDKGLDLAIAAAGCQCTLHQNFYSNVGPAGALAGFESPVGVVHVAAGISFGYWAWLQVSGPAFVAATAGWPGAVANYRDVYFHQDGTINSGNGETVGTTSPPRVGYAIESGNYGVCLIMLQLRR